ncbi:MAG: hypothetical protein K6C69_03875 [Lachnospiraceae bacterium]|nr:hypothetical protein [Lachnospiraceae bacterium]
MKKMTRGMAVGCAALLMVSQTNTVWATEVEQVTEVSTQVPTEEVTESITEAVTEPATEPATEATTAAIAETTAAPAENPETSPVAETTAATTETTVAPATEATTAATTAATAVTEATTGGTPVATTAPATTAATTAPATTAAKVMITESSMSVTKDSNNVYITLTWPCGENYVYQGFGDSQSIGITYADAANVSDQYKSIIVKDTAVPRNGWWHEIPGSVLNLTNNYETDGSATLYVAVPLDYFKTSNFILNWNGNTKSVNVAENLDATTAATTAAQSTEAATTAATTAGSTETTAAGASESATEATTQAPQPASYEGITVDGNFSDWDAVGKVGFADSGEHDYLRQTSVIYDGDYIYIYIQDQGNESATGAGTHSNGRYSITTDLGRTMDFQLQRGGVVAGVDGSSCSVTDDQWEIAIPASNLPANNGTFSFGLYQSEPVISGISNISGATANQVTDTKNVSYDGDYSEWDGYGHTLIQYATAGTQVSEPDGEAALYTTGNTIYGHVVTTMDEHTSEAGGEMTQAVTIQVNQDNNYNFYPRFAAVDSEGNINWNVQTSNLPEGTYEFYLFDSQGWGSAKNLSDLESPWSGDALYGKAYVTVSDGKDDMEFQIDSEALAEKFGLAATDLQVIGAQFGRIGNQWVETAGASSGAGLGIALSAGVVAMYYLRKKNWFLTV